MRKDASIGVSLYGRDVSASKALNKVGKVSEGVAGKMKLAAAAAGAVMLKIGKDSIAAAMADAKAQAVLAKQLDNMGFGSATGAVTEFVSQMQLATNVTEEKLRPAMAKAMRATDDLTASQELLGLAADVATGANKDFDTVVTALTKAIAGNRKGLNSLDTGMSKAYIASANMSDIIGQLEKKFGGSATTAVQTWGGQWENLQITLGEAEETIGVGIVQAFSILATQGGASMDGLTSKVNTFADTTANVFVGLASLAKSSSSDSGLAAWLKSAFGTSELGFIYKLIGKGTGMLASKGAETKRLAEEQARETDRENRRAGALTKTNKSALSTLKKVADAKTKVTTATKKSNTAAAKSLALAKLSAKFDLTLIGIAAAKKRTTDKGDLNRLNALNLIATDAAGLPVSDSALNAANKQMTIINNYISGSLVTEGELHGFISDSVKQQQLRGGGYGKWGGGL